MASSSFVKGSYSYEKPKPEEYTNGYNIDVNVEVSASNILAKCENFCADVSGVFEEAKDVAKVEKAFFEAFNKTGGTPFKLNTINVNNPKNLFVPVSKINELRRLLYAQIVPDYKKGTLPQTSQNKNSEKGKWIVKTDNLQNLAELNLADFAEIIYLINPHTEIKDILSLPKNKVRIALPEVCRHPQIFAKIINSLLESGYKKWEVGNYWGLNVLDAKKLDVSLSSSVYTLNSQAIETAKEIGIGRVCLSVEDINENIKSVVSNSSLNTCFIVYQDAPLFISAGCIRDNDCKNCKGGIEVVNLSKDGRNYTAVSKDCQLMMFNNNPLCFASEAKNIDADFYRLDFCHKKYTPSEVKKIADVCKRFEDVKMSLKANINSQKI